MRDSESRKKVPVLVTNSYRLGYHLAKSLSAYLEERYPNIEGLLEVRQYIDDEKAVVFMDSEAYRIIYGVPKTDLSPFLPQ